MQVLPPAPVAGPSFGEPLLAALSGGRPFVLDGLLGAPVARSAWRGAVSLHAAGRLRQAGVGRGAHVDRVVRGDAIRWLDPARPPRSLRPVVAALDAVRQWLNDEAWLGLRSMEVQVARYPGDGTGYGRHRDALRHDPARRITAIWYLNPGWRPSHGGELRAWTEEDGPCLVEPLLDRLVLFRSDRIDHEVLPALRPRYAVTAWMRGDIPG